MHRSTNTFTTKLRTMESLTKIVMTNGKELIVKGSTSDVVKEFNSKPNTKVIESRINDNYTVWINGENIGEIQN